MPKTLLLDQQVYWFYHADYEIISLDEQLIGLCVLYIDAIFPQTELNFPYRVVREPCL